jgi:hypothetical protein
MTRDAGMTRDVAPSIIPSSSGTPSALSRFINPPTPAPAIKIPPKAITQTSS